MNTQEHSIYNKSNPFLAAISKRYKLCKNGSEKNTCHIELDLSGSGITYQVGDSIAVFPTNDPVLVEKTIHACKAKGSEPVADKHTGETFSFKDYLSKKANLAEVQRKLIQELLQRQTHPQKKERLANLLAEGQRELLKEYQAAHEVWNALSENQEVDITPQELVLMLQPLLPRFYSISSSMLEVGESVHLTVADLKYETNGFERRGACTHYLCHLAPLNDFSIPIYVQPSHGFTLPEDLSAPVIMIGPGTGIAPFRAFMQERHVTKATGKNWIFFGEQHRAQHFFYEDYWDEMVKKELLRFDTAFSRDQEHKIYVQHRMQEFGEEFFDWLEKGAYVYVCGDAKRMAKDVDAALHHIIQTHKQCDEKIAKDYVKQLKANKRYLRDVY